ncbi:right-handed parallel beta-helix repeat-containing protein [Sorangium sp. So ce291]|uniref:right-handed parallel beta-helix repeat-containing protein n=1 Tax=Sorangium sp. So ce291 TaxID=3133294 RepID=UPI003F5EFCB1
MIFNVKNAPYNAVGDGTALDRQAIQNAIDAAEAAGGGVVYIPKGTYKLDGGQEDGQDGRPEGGLKVEDDGVILEGEGRETVLKYYNNSPASHIIPLHFTKPPSADKPDLKNVGVRDLTIEFANAGPDSAGGLTMTGCVDFFCERITVRGNGTGMSGSTTNGITINTFSSDGIISGCVVEGVSKPGIYLSAAARVTVVGCMSKKNLCTAPGTPEAGAGFQIAQVEAVSLIDCYATGSAVGFNVVCMGGDYGSGTIDASPAPSPTSFNVTLVQAKANSALFMRRLGIWNPTTQRIEELRGTSATLVSGKTWTVTLPADNTQTIAAGATIFVNYHPFKNVRIIGGSAKDNVVVYQIPDPQNPNTLKTIVAGVGVNVSSFQPGAVGRDLVISGLVCEGNPDAGIIMSVVEDAIVEGCILRNNRVGIQLSDVGTADAIEQTKRILVSGCEIYDNENVGVHLRSVEDVTVQGTRIYRTKNTVQTAPIRIERVDADRRKTTNLKLRDLDFSGYNISTPVIPTSGDSDAVEDGLYDLAFFGSPEGNLYAPAGSRYLDRATGNVYRKVHGWKKNNWMASLVTHYRFEGTTTSAPVNLYALPDNSVVHASVVAVARNANGDCAVYRRALGARRQSSALAVAVGEVQTIGTDGTNNPGWGFTLNVQNNFIRASIVGGIGANIDWLIRTEIDVYTA